MINSTGKAAKVLFLSTITALLLAASASAHGDLAVGAGITTGSALRLRAEASTTSSILTTLDKGITLAVLDTSSSGWYKVSYAGRTGFVSADYLKMDEDNIFDAAGRLTGDGVNLRSAATTDSAVLGSLSKGSAVTVTGLENSWYAVTAPSGTKGYIRSDFVNLTASVSSIAGSGGVVALAQQYLGTPYVYGGSAPGGFDCSGFITYLFRQFGYSLPRTATDQWLRAPGTRISYEALQPGDLVYFCDPSRSNGKACSHAGLYVGNGQLIHASSARNGVIYSDMTSGYYRDYFVGAIRLL